MNPNPVAPLETRGLCMAYGKRPIIEGLDLRLPAGQVTAIVGPNGCGKSTLLAGLARLQKPSGGAVLLDGKAIASLPSKEVARRLALLPQDASAPDGLTVAELIRFGRQPHQGLFQQWSAEDQKVVDAALAAADLGELAERPLESMSGGQRQRAWIAMAIAQDTPLLLLDEPTSALDLGHQIEVFELIRHLAEAGKTVVMVVHDLSSACRYADHLVAMKGGQVLAEGAPARVVTAELVEALYGVRCTLLSDPYSGTPLIVGASRVRACFS
ncbi:iron complex transport system ATP-binding protein [Pseudomonas citronellolis]|jgi:iron complex transport system ATP-binding protein|nr:iron complex transport system ATP-binding protein [Pseudomonas citronellolis]GLU39062.1 cobalamin/Fe3+-siderophore ABC transporter ATP-binding protein [Pseudomonas sp. NBRC 100443]MCP1665434.1 iron complex transport system ATP-binding protein [Pseudomonas citronellolis]MCP1696288.1 iron complex transport system ATP-binding protein [Pseudomonas citronellolis]MCP1702971.1 iron complex transport system ATP-binding protein [Pseudomonas citronellolis]